MSAIISIVAIVSLLAIAGYSFNLERSRAGLFLLLVMTVTALLELFDSTFAVDGFGLTL